MAYVKIIFQNSPSTATPMNAQNLNHMDDQIALNDQRLTELEGAHVSSFNGRTGAVTPADGDYDIGQIAPLTGAQVGQVPVVTNIGTEEAPELVFRMGAGGGAGGHEIIDSEGNTMPQESAMQFPDSHVSDDSTNGRTVVENIKEVDPADYASTTDEGIIVTDDGDDALIGSVSDDYIEVTADGTKSYSQILDGMYGDADINKLNNYSILRIGNDIYSVDGEWRFSRGRNNSSNFNYTSIEFRASGSKVYSSNGSTTPTDISSTLVTNGTKITLYYGNKKATVDLQTTANRCLLTDGETTVADVIDAGEWSELITLNARVKYRYNNRILIVYPNGNETALIPWNTSVLGTLPNNLFTILSTVSSHGVIDGSSHSFKRGRFSVNTNYAVSLSAWEDGMTGGSQVPISSEGIIVPIKLK